MPLSTMIQLYHGGHFYQWRKPEYPENTTNLWQVTSKLYQQTTEIAKQYHYTNLLYYRVYDIISSYCIIFSMYRSMFNRLNVGWRGHDHMVVGFTITYAISTYHHYMVVGFTTTYI